MAILNPTKNIEMLEPVTKSPGYKYRLYTARIRDEVDMDKFPKAEGGIISTKIPMKDEAKFAYICALSSSIIPAIANSNDLLGQLTIPLTIEGISGELLDTLYNMHGDRYIVIIEHCSSGKKFIGGSPCSSGLKFTYQNIGTNDNVRSATCQFQGEPCSDPLWEYDSDIPGFETELA